MYATLMSRVGLPLMLRPTRSRFDRHAKEIRARQFWPAERRRQWQWERLQAIVRHAATTVPFYRERLAAAGLRDGELRSWDDFERIPPTTKDDLEANFPDRMLSDVGDRSDWRWFGTRGTTRRTIVVNDFLKRDLGLAGIMVSMTEDTPYQYGHRCAFIPPDACNALCGVEGLRETSVLRQVGRMALRRSWSDPDALGDLRSLVMNNWVKRQTLLPPFGAEGSEIDDERASWYVAQLRAVRPRLLKALPEYLYGLARHVERTGDRFPPIAVIKPMGALMARPIKDYVERVLGGQVREDYGSSDMGPMAFDCRQRTGMHLFEDLCHFEVVRDGARVADGELGSLLVTELHNRAMPLIRYQIGDVVRVERSPCDCGRTTPRLFTEGRLQNALVRPDRSVLTDAAIGDYLYRQPQVSDYQLVERAGDRFELKVIPRNGDKASGLLAERVRRFIDADAPVRLREVKTIAPEGSGKFCHCKSASYAAFGA